MLKSFTFYQLISSQKNLQTSTIIDFFVTKSVQISTYPDRNTVLLHFGVNFAEQAVPK